MHHHTRDFWDFKETFWLNIVIKVTLKKKSMNRLKKISWIAGTTNQRYIAQIEPIAFF